MIYSSLKFLHWGRSGVPKQCSGTWGHTWWCGIAGCCCLMLACWISRARTPRLNPLVCVYMWYVYTGIKPGFHSYQVCVIALRYIIVKMHDIKFAILAGMPMILCMFMFYHLYLAPSFFSSVCFALGPHLTILRDYSGLFKNYSWWS